MSSSHSRCVRSITSLAALAGVSLGLLGGCAAGGGESGSPITLPVLPGQEKIPPELLYAQYLVDDGGLAEIEAELNKRAKEKVDSDTLSFSAIGHGAAVAPVLKGSQVERRLNSLKDCLLRSWPGDRRPDVKVAVSSSQAPGGEALPNEVRINIGLLQDEAVAGGEIAYVLAHELSHVILDHYQREEFRNSQDEAFQKLARVGVAASALAEVSTRKTANGIEFVPGEPEAIRRGIVAIGAAYQISQLLADGIVESAWSRRQETQADRLGTDLLLGSSGRYTDYNAPFLLFDRLERHAKDRKTNLDRFEKQSSTAMDEALSTGKVDQIVATAAETLTQGLSAAFRDVLNWLNRTHPKPAVRRKDLVKYGDPRYDSDAPATLLAGGSCDYAAVQKATKRREFTRASQALKDSAAIHAALIDQDYDVANALAKKVVRSSIGRHPMVRTAAYEAAKAQGRDKEALKHLEAISLDGDTPYSVFANLAAEQIRMGRPTRSQRTIRRASEFYPPETFYPLQLQAADAAGDDVETARVAALCEASKAQWKQTARQCRQLLKTRVQASGATGSTDGGGLFGALKRAGQKLNELVE